ncbi:phytoceramidase [Coprinopsis marcescibilis]|uniref:Phytoceramidase n=1 Tax=Coprinopsis marcescibilis TaxID=230819 RepID=A0A5C3KJ79_COPMA|nr:phytoceramidase [Coprinopsis marcescibilis]
MLNLTSVAPYLQKQGIWGPVTATLDWCEVNHQFSPYIAEMANTLSNLFTVGIALAGLHEAAVQKLPPRYIMGYLGVALVGIGSFFFHATLQYHAQLADELPMIYVGSMSLWLLFDNKPGFGVSTLRTKFLIAATIILDILFSWTYILYRNPVYHQVVFGTMVVSTAARVAYILQHSEASRRIPDKQKAVIGKLFSSGAILFALGFLLWNLDNGFCHRLTQWKLRVGWPQAFALEGNRFQSMLGAGTYYMFSGIHPQFSTLCTKDDPKKYQMFFRHGLPHIRNLELSAKRD